MLAVGQIEQSLKVDFANILSQHRGHWTNEEEEEFDFLAPKNEERQFMVKRRRNAPEKMAHPVDNPALQRIVQVTKDIV